MSPVLTSESTSFESIALHRWIVLGLALFAFGMSAAVSRVVFERLPHLEDEMAYLFGARAIAGGNFVVPEVEPSAAYWQPFVVDYDGVRFSKYTPGWSMQLAIGVWLRAEWFVNAAFAALGVALTYRLGKALFGRDTGLIAAALIAFSPMAVLLNGSLMGHTAALLWTILFIDSFFRVRRGQRRMIWALTAGFALGMLILSRPLTAIGIAAPFVIWSLADLGRVLRQRAQFISLMRGFVALSAVALLLAAIIPVYNYQATGDPAFNLYRLVWDYDRVGFGEGYGRNDHTLEKGVRHARFDLSLTAADLFGWTIGSICAQGVFCDGEGLRGDVAGHLLNQADYFEIIGVSWLLLPAALLVTYRRDTWRFILWIAVGLGILSFPFAFNPALTNQLQFSWYAWLTVIALMVWACAPLLVLRDSRQAWVWAMFAILFCLLIVHLAYWIGSQRYSTRYYYEALIAAALLTALPIAWLARRFSRRVVYAAFTLLLLWSFFGYTLPRVGVLRGFNLISNILVEAVESRREGDQPVLVIVNGSDVRWRAYAALMAHTSPYLDSPIVAVRASSPSQRDAVLASFPDRQVIELEGRENAAWFP